MQHPTARFLAHPMFESLRRWSRGRSRRTDPRSRPRSPPWTPAASHRSHRRVVGSGRTADRQRRGRRFVRRHPDRLLGVAVGRSASAARRRPRAAPLRARARLSRAARRAVALGPAARRSPLLPALRGVRRARRAVLFAGRPHRTAQPSQPGRPIPHLDRVALDFPELTIVGGPHRLAVDGRDDRARDQVSQRLHRHLRLHGRRYPPELVAYLRGHGRRKVLFGSNHPAWPAARCLGELASLDLDAETTELFLFRNAERVFALAVLTVAMLPFVILGFLIDQPRHGYDLKRVLSPALTRDRQLNDGVLYPLLAKLMRDGHVRRSVERAGRPRAPRLPGYRQRSRALSRLARDRGARGGRGHLRFPARSSFPRQVHVLRAARASGREGPSSRRSARPPPRSSPSSGPFGQAWSSVASTHFGSRCWSSGSRSNARRSAG